MRTQISKDYLKGKLDTIFNFGDGETNLNVRSLFSDTISFVYWICKSRDISFWGIEKMLDELNAMCGENFADFGLSVGSDEYLFISFLLPSNKFTDQSFNEMVAENNKKEDK